MKTFRFPLGIAATLVLPLLVPVAFAPVARAQTAPLDQTKQITWPLRSNEVAAAGKEIALQAPLARRILDGWQAQHPVRGDRVLRLVYWTPADREPAPRYRERLSAIMLDIQAFYAREMARNGFGPRTFKLPGEADGMLQIFVARGSKTRDKYSGDNGGEIRADSLKALHDAGIDGDQETFLIFCNLTNWDAVTRARGGSSPYYALGTTRNGTAWQVDSPVLDLAQLTNVAPADKVRDEQYGFITLGRYNSIFIGGIAHELGHALSMPHNLERPDMAAWGKSLMGSGNRTYGEELRPDADNESGGKGTFLPFADALRLASHPSFCGSVKGFATPPNANISEVKITTDGKRITYAARVQADPPVYGVIGYFDPSGGGDYDATTATAIPDREGRFSLTCDALARGKTGILRVVTLQANGAASSAAAGNGTSPLYPYNVGADGTVDLNLWNAEQQLAPLSAAVKSGQRAQVEAALRDLEAQGAPESVLEIARVQLAAFDTQPKPSPETFKGATLWLADALPTAAQVGWFQPAYNRLPFGPQNPDQEVLLAAGEQYFAHGIYAHAPARHTYALGGRWGRFTGLAAAPNGFSPSVVFVILADGKEVWRSPPIGADGRAPFDVAVAGVQILELRVEDGGNGNSSDWAVWLDPRLVR